MAETWADRGFVAALRAAGDPRLPGRGRDPRLPRSRRPRCRGREGPSAPESLCPTLKPIEAALPNLRFGRAASMATQEVAFSSSFLSSALLIPCAPEMPALRAWISRSSRLA
ncbi:hypothetical protein Lesp02_59970 [Lentzea sp. NBRC 105346]|nr:hypothetical protein Lesp02_59970 [Lentzea sp. NBRC 105346]